VNNCKSTNSATAYWSTDLYLNRVKCSKANLIGWYSILLVFIACISVYEFCDSLYFNCCNALCQVVDQVLQAAIGLPYMIHRIYSKKATYLYFWLSKLHISTADLWVLIRHLVADWQGAALQHGRGILAWWLLGARQTISYSQELNFTTSKAPVRKLLFHGLINPWVSCTCRW
jgi:hypothetical protein